MAEIWP